MEMTKENFDKMLFIDGWKQKEGPASVPNAKHTYQSSYIPPYDKYKKYTILAVYTYPDRYEAKVYYKSGNSLSLPCETENDAYALLYRFIYDPESIRFIEKCEEIEKEVTEEEFVSQKENPFYKMNVAVSNLFKI